MGTVLLILGSLIILLLLVILTGKIINAQRYKIHSPNGIQETRYITIGGIQQYIQIRGQDISNPLIIVLHGGPGNNMAFYSYYWQKRLEQDYTIIHWDQRGCGNTYYHNTTAQKPTLDLLLSDLDELVAFVCSKFRKQKVVLMGHSWGTFLGAVYSIIHPEKVSAYVSISQMLDFKKSEQVSAQEAIRLAGQLGKINDVRKIEEKLNLVLSFRDFEKSQAIELLRFRELKEKYLPAQYSNKMFALRLFSPYITFHDMKWSMSIDKLVFSNDELYKTLLSENNSSIWEYGLIYKVPIIMIAGENDWTTPYEMITDYFNNITAPFKELVAIKNTGHIPFIDKPEIFSEKLMSILHSLDLN